jgi:hypothetical protein
VVFPDFLEKVSWEVRGGEVMVGDFPALSGNQSGRLLASKTAKP